MRRSAAARRLLTLALSVAAVATVASACGSRERAPVRLYAAASLVEVLDGLLPGYDPPVTASYAASSVLARQIEAGAPPGVFVSASVEWAEHLERAGLVEPGTRTDLLCNRLVVVVPAGSSFAPATLAELARPDVERLALADPEHVPAGRYARAALEHAGAWEPLRRRVVASADVRHALALVARGEVDAGIVYATDARTAAVTVAFEVPPGSHVPVRYTGLVVRGAPPDAAELLRFLSGPRARAAFSDAGFVVTPEAAAGLPPR